MEIGMSSEPFLTDSRLWLAAEEPTYEYDCPACGEHLSGIGEGASAVWLHARSHTAPARDDVVDEAGGR